MFEALICDKGELSSACVSILHATHTRRILAFSTDHFNYLLNATGCYIGQSTEG